MDHQSKPEEGVAGNEASSSKNNVIGIGTAFSNVIVNFFALKAPIVIRVALFATWLALTLGALFWINRRQIDYKTMALPIAIMLAAVAIVLASVTSSYNISTSGKDVPYYYVNVSAFRDDNGNGIRDGQEHGIDTNILLSDRAGPLQTIETDEKGEAQISTRAYGWINLGVCGIFQSHYVERENSTKDKALQIQVAISPADMVHC